MNQDAFKNPLIVLGLIVGGAFIVATLILSWTAFGLKSAEHTLSVTGSAKKTVEADAVRMTFTVTRSVYENDLTNGYEMLDADFARVKEFIGKAGVLTEEVTYDPVSTYKVYDYSNNPGPTTYSLSRRIHINSSRVAEITAFADSLVSLQRTGIFIETNNPEYYYTKLDELRIELLSEALKDARARAAALAQESGRGVGRLQSAASGVVQVLAPNSIDVSDYGQYDTSSIQKEVMVTTRAAFEVK